MINIYQQIAKKTLPIFKYNLFTPNKIGQSNPVNKRIQLFNSPSFSFSLEKKKQQEKINKMMQEATIQNDQKLQKEYKKSGQLYPEAHKEYSQLSDEAVSQAPSGLWNSLLLLQLPQAFYLYQAVTSDYFSFSFSNNLSLLVDSACLNMGLLGGMYFGYAILKKESYHILLTPFTLICLGFSMHLAYNLNPVCFIPIYLAQLIQVLADYQGSSSRRYPSFLLSIKSRYFMINFIITLLGFLVMQGFQNYQTEMKNMKVMYEQQSRELDAKQRTQNNIKK